MIKIHDDLVEIQDDDDAMMTSRFCARVISRRSSSASNLHLFASRRGCGGREGGRIVWSKKGIQENLLQLISKMILSKITDSRLQSDS